MSKNVQNKNMKNVILWTLIGIASAAVIAFCIYCFAVVIPAKREADRLALEEQKNQQLTIAPTNEPTATPGLTEQPTPTEPAVTVEPTAEPTATVVPSAAPAITEEPTVAPTEEPKPTATSTPIPTEVPHEHKWTAKEQPAACTVGGRTWEECECGELQNEVILEATGHGKLVYAVVKEPTADVEGEYEEVCEVCKEVVNKGTIKKLDPTPIPTATSTPTPKPTATPKPTNTPIPTATSTPTPRPTSTPKPTATPKPTNTPAPTPTTSPLAGEMVISGGETTVTLKELTSVEYNIFLTGTFSDMNVEYTLADSSILYAELTKGTSDRQYTLKLQPTGMNGKTSIILTMTGVDEYGTKVVCDEVMINVKVELMAYNPAADGYPYHVETWTHEGLTVEVWTKNENTTNGVLIFTGVGAVTRDFSHNWTTRGNHKTWYLEKMYFGEGITEIQAGLPKEYITEVHFPSTLKVIGAGAFQNANLIEVILPEGLERVERGAFKWCYELEKVVLPSTLTYIGSGAFEHKVQTPWDFENELKEVVIPKSVEYIGYGAFEYRRDLTLVLEQGINTKEYAEGWNYDGSDKPLTMITE